MNHTKLSVLCCDQTLSLLNTPKIASGGINEDLLTIDFSSEWDDFCKTAVFYRSEEDVYHVIIENDSCIIPREVTSEAGIFYFGIIGINGDTVRTSDVIGYTVKKGAITEATAVSDPTPDIYSQILRRIDVLEQLSGISFDENRMVVTMDSALSSESENPVKNKVITEALSKKQNTVTGAVSNVVNNNLTVNRAVITDKYGKIAASERITETELNMLDGVSSNIQKQLDSKALAVDIPTSLHNPQSVKFTGGADAEYDGSKSVEVNIPVYDRLLRSVTGKSFLLSDASENRLYSLKLYGKTIAESSENNKLSSLVSSGDRGEINVNVYGRNLIYMQDKEDTLNGIDYSIKNGGVTLSGNTTEKEFFITLCTLRLPKGRFRISGGSSNANLRIGKGQLSENFGQDNGNGRVFDNNTDGELFKIAVRILNTLEIGTAISETIYPMLTYSAQPNEFEMGKEPQNIRLSVPDNFSGIPVESDGNYIDANGQQWICDEVDFERGVYTKRTMKVIFNGSETWTPFVTNNTSQDSIYRMSTEILKNKIIGNADTTLPSEAMCDTYSVVAAGNKGTYGKNTGISVAVNGTVHIYDSNYCSADSINDWISELSENPITCIFKIPPVEIPLSGEAAAAYKTMHMHTPITNIITDSNADMTAVYAVDNPTSDIVAKNLHNIREGSHWLGKTWYAYGTSLTADETNGYASSVAGLSGLKLVNKGVAGGLVSDQKVKNAIMNITDGKPEADLITLEVGFSDDNAVLGTIYDTGNSTFCGVLNNCIRYLQNNTDAQIAVISSPQIGCTESGSLKVYSPETKFGSDNHTKFDQFEAIRKVCAINGVPYIPMGEYSGLGCARLNSDNFIEDTKLSEDGAKILADYVWNQLKNIALWK